MKPSMKSFKRAGEMHDGINQTVHSLLSYLKHVQKDCIQFAREYRAGDRGAFWRLHDARTRRADLIWAIRIVVQNTTNGVLHDLTWSRRTARREAQVQAALAKKEVAA